MAALSCQCQFPHTSVLSTASISVPQSCSSHVGFFLGSPWTRFVRCKRLLHGSRITRKRGVKLQRTCVIAFLLPVDPWNPNSDSQGIASSLFASSLLPYLGFLYHITKSKTSPKLTLFGFYFLLAFVGATIPAGVYAKVHYGTSLSNVDWLHGGAESLLTLTNLFIVIGLRKAIREAVEDEEKVIAEEEKDVPLLK
ncbi:unnamed protein product [Sphagnum jensenii]|uniref:1-acyl-sn-glycerol-3-phosphate acyltransferase n=1 Tax=Sphagnum jensenii TaxID=128206 RepID=A0ABP1BK42_9BRYO